MCVGVCVCDMSIVLTVILLDQALVDVAASEGWLGPVLRAMLLVQMTVQGCWQYNSSLITLPALCREHLPLLSRALHRLVLPPPSASQPAWLHVPLP